MENITLTQKRTSSPKLFLLLSSIIALLSNVAIIILLGVNGGGLQYYIAPIVLGAMDLLLIASVLLTNYRFKYGLYESIAYIAIVFVTIVATMVFRYQGNKARIFSLISEIIWIFVHLATMVAVFFTTLRAAKYRKWAMPTGIATFGAFAAACAAYVIYIAVTGYFGQGAVGMLRPLLYEYDQTTKTYTVVGVGEGKGDTIVIPESFDTIKVSKIDCNVFAVDTVKDVYLECANTATFTNLAALSDFNSNVKVHIPKANYDMLRNGLYTQMASVGNVTSIANNVKALTEVMAPAGLAEDEVYVSYTYTKEDLKSVNGNYLPTKYLKKGTVFNAADYAEEIPYAAHMSETSDEDLHWSFNNLQQCIFTGFYNGETALEGAKIDKDIQNVSLKFEKIYRVSILDDNDTKYEIEDSFTQTMVNNEALTYRYMTENTANDVLASIQLRDGFDLAWYYGYTEFSDLKGFLKDTIQPSNYEIVSIKPNWTLRVPTITELKTNYADNKVTYGEDLKFSATAQAPADGFELELKWLKQASVEHTGTTYEIDTIDIDQGGSYTLSVTASWPEKTSLTSNVRQDIDVEVLKRAMPFTWTLPADHVYAAADKIMQAAHDVDEVVNEDVISYFIQNEVIRDAGTYELKVILTGDTAERYYVPEEYDNEFTITPYQLTANWASLVEFTYDGEEHVAQVNETLSHIGDEDGYAVPIKVTGARVDACANINNNEPYVATAESLDKNYTLTNPTQNFIIHQRPITFVWELTTDLTYNGKVQSVSVVELNNIVEGEETAILSKLNYTGAETNVGGYVMNASFPEGCNYKYAEGETGDHNYAILRAPLTVTLNSQWKTYDGKIFTANEEEKYSYVCEGLQGEDTFEEVFANFAYAGTAMDAINQGTYVIDTSYDEGTKYGNYNLNQDSYAIDVTTLTIEKRLVSFTWQETLSFVYNSAEQTISVVDIINVVEGEKETALESLIYSEDNIQINVGHYLATVVFPEDSNYATASEETGEMFFDITPKALKITLQAAEKTYNAQPYLAEAPFESVHEGLEGEDQFDQVIAEFQFAGEAVEAVNAGSYSLSATYSDSAEKYNNYEITLEESTLTIHKRPITVRWQEECSFTYNATERSLVVEGVDECVEGEEGIILDSLSYTGKQTNVGAHMMTANLPTVTNYVFANAETNTQAYEITPMNLTVTVKNATAEYDGVIYDGGFTFEWSALAGEDKIGEVFVPNYTGTAATAVNVGEYVINAENKGATKKANYAITVVPGALTITKRAVTIKIDEVKATYDGAIYDGGFTIKAEGLATTDNVSQVFVPTYIGAEEARNVGTYNVNATNAGAAKTENYTITVVPNTLTITKRAAVVTVENLALDYNAQAKTGFSISIGNKATGDSIESIVKDITYKGAGTTAINAGSYDVEVNTYNEGEEFNNYELSFAKGTLTINKVVVTPTWGTNTFTYDTAAHILTITKVTGLIGDEKMEDVLGITYTNNTQTNAGTYTVTASLPANINYTFANGALTATTSLKIAKVALTITIKSAKTEHTYDGNIYSDFTYASGALVGSDTLDEVLTFNSYVTYDKATGQKKDAKNVGTYEVRMNYTEGAKFKNYDLKWSYATLTITPKEITLTWPSQASYDSKEVSEAALKARGVVGAVSGDNVLASLSYTGYSAAEGTHTITASTSNANYKIKNPTFTYTVTVAKSEDKK